MEGSDQGEDLPRVMVTLTLDWPHATNKGDVSRPMPVAEVMQKQGIPALDLTCTATRNQQQAPGQANRYSSSEQWLGHTRRSSPRRT